MDIHGDWISMEFMELMFFCDLMMCSYMVIRQFNHNGNMNDDI